MKRREMLVTTGTVAATALAGCSASGQSDDDGGDGGDGGAVGDSGPENSRTITVSGSGDAEGEPDLAVLHLGVEIRADTAQDARTELAERAEAVREALLSAGVDESDVTTNRYHVRERLDRRRMEAEDERPDSREEAEEYIYYEGVHQYTVEVSDIDAVGSVIDAAVDGGANAVDHVTFTLSDERRAQLREQALREALGNARSEADAIADEIGATVVEATVVDASDARVSPVRREFAAEQGGDAGGEPTEAPPETGVEPGDVTVTAEVHVRYRME